jgi:acyl carrier protein
MPQKSPLSREFSNGRRPRSGAKGRIVGKENGTMAEYNQTTYDAVADDLGIDSLDFLDVTFAIDKKFGIKMPVEKWMEDVNEGRAKAEEFFVMSNLVRRIDELVAQKAPA